MLLGATSNLITTRRDLWLTTPPCPSRWAQFLTVSLLSDQTRQDEIAEMEPLGEARRSIRLCTGGGVMVSGPLDVFVRGTNDHLMHKWWNGGTWSHWEDLGGHLSEGPALFPGITIASIASSSTERNRKALAQMVEWQHVEPLGEARRSIRLCTGGGVMVTGPGAYVSSEARTIT